MSIIDIKYHHHDDSKISVNILKANYWFPQKKSKQTEKTVKH